MMRAGGGKAKGAEFERSVCKRLSLWLSGGMRDDLFWRSAMSGGRASVQFKKGKLAVAQESDISAIDPLGHQLTDRFVVECKCVKDLHIQTMMHLPNAKDGIGGYWRTLQTIAIRSNKMPMLIAKENNGPVWVVLNGDGIDHFRLYGYKDQHPVVMNITAYNAHFVLFDNFLSRRYLTLALIPRRGSDGRRITP